MTKSTWAGLLAAAICFSATAARARCGAQDKPCLQKSALETARRVNAAQAGGAADKGASVITSEGQDDFQLLVRLLSNENQADGEAEAAAAGVSFDDYVSKRDTLVWDNFEAKVDAAREQLASASPEELFAEQLKLQLRFQAQQRRFVADRQLEVEREFWDYSDDVLDKLGFKKPQTPKR